MDIKKGATPCSNLVNLKSNTMKNTVQRYGFFRNLQIQNANLQQKKCYLTHFCRHKQKTPSKIGISEW